MVVTDTGAGISSSNQQKLFREIVQFNPEVLQAGGGSGLGLWITSSIVDLHGGTISVYSDGLGRGSTFTVEIDMNRLISYTRYFDRLDRPNPSFPSPFPSFPPSHRQTGLLSFALLFLLILIALQSEAKHSHSLSLNTNSLSFNPLTRHDTPQQKKNTY